MKPKRTIPKKLGAKKTGDQSVIPGNIIYKQRGTIWHPGENTIMGRDHTIHAAIAGYVKYYRDPARHPDRQYIGVTHTRDEKLPYPIHSPRRRPLNMVVVPRKLPRPEADVIGPSGIPRFVVRKRGDAIVQTINEDGEVVESTAVQQPRRTKGAANLSPSQLKEREQQREKQKIWDDEHAKDLPLGRQRWLARKAEKRERKRTRIMRLQPDYSYRETNWEIGRLVGPAGIVGGTVKLSSRKRKLRERRRRRETYFAKQRRLAVVQAVERRAARKAKRQRRALRHKELREAQARENQKEAAARKAADELAAKPT